MSKYEKLFIRIMSGTADSNIDFPELQKALTLLGFTVRIKGDHFIYIKDGVEEIINIQPDGNKAKPYQVKQVRNIILKYRMGGISVHKYEVILYWSDEDNSYIAEVPELAGCMADGKTMSEALCNVHTVIDEWIETAKLAGREIPKPKGKLAFA